MENNPPVDSIASAQINSLSMINEGKNKVIEKCQHFSIRGYVEEQRKKDIKACAPFPFKGNEELLRELLGPLHVPRNRWWRCKRCVAELVPVRASELPDSNTDVRGATEPNASDLVAVAELSPASNEADNGVLELRERVISSRKRDKSVAETEQVAGSDDEPRNKVPKVRFVSDLLQDERSKIPSSGASQLLATSSQQGVPYQGVCSNELAVDQIASSSDPKKRKATEDLLKEVECADESAKFIASAGDVERNAETIVISDSESDKEATGLTIGFKMPRLSKGKMAIGTGEVGHSSSTPLKSILGENSRLHLGANPIFTKKNCMAENDDWRTAGRLMGRSLPPDNTLNTEMLRHINQKVAIRSRIFREQLNNTPPLLRPQDALIRSNTAAEPSQVAKQHTANVPDKQTSQIFGVMPEDQHERRTFDLSLGSANQQKRGVNELRFGPFGQVYGSGMSRLIQEQKWSPVNLSNVTRNIGQSSTSRASGNLEAWNKLRVGDRTVTGSSPHIIQGLDANKRGGNIGAQQNGMLGGNSWPFLAPGSVPVQPNILQKSRMSNVGNQALLPELQKEKRISGFDLNVAAPDAAEASAEQPDAASKGIDMEPNRNECSNEAIQFISLMNGPMQTSRAPLSSNAKNVPGKPSVPYESPPKFSTDRRPNSLFNLTKEFIAGGPSTFKAGSIAAEMPSANTGRELVTPQGAADKGNVPSLPSQNKDWVLALPARPTVNIRDSDVPKDKDTGAVAASNAPVFPFKLQTPSNQSDKSKTRFSPYVRPTGLTIQDYSPPTDTKKGMTSGASYDVMRCSSPSPKGVWLFGNLVSTTACDDKQKGIIDASQISSNNNTDALGTHVNDEAITVLTNTAETLNCTLNQNPADFSVPDGENDYMIPPEHLKPIKAATSRRKPGTGGQRRSQGTPKHVAPNENVQNQKQ